MVPENETNAKVLKALEQYGTRENAHSGYTVDGYEVRVHPDLVERLRVLGQYAPDARFEYLFGTPVLSTPTGNIFATACGTSSLHLRLPEDAAWGGPYEEYGKPWRQGRAWVTGRPRTPEDEERFAALVAMAYSSAASEK